MPQLRPDGRPGSRYVRLNAARVVGHARSRLDSQRNWNVWLLCRRKERPERPGSRNSGLISRRWRQSRGCLRPCFLRWLFLVAWARGCWYRGREEQGSMNLRAESVEEDDFEYGWSFCEGRGERGNELGERPSQARPLSTRLPQSSCSSPAWSMSHVAPRVPRHIIQ